MIGWSELVVIALVLLIFVGPKQLPGLLRKMGQLIGELKSASNDLRNQVTEEMRDIEQSVGDIPSPRAIIRDAASGLTDDFRSTYAEAKRVGDEAKEELTDLKKEIQTAADTRRDGDKVPTKQQDDGAAKEKARKEEPS